MRFVNKEFGDRFDEFMVRINNFLKADVYPNRKITFTTGGKYIKVIDDKYGDGESCSVYAFIDKSSGDLLKPASWKAPAKHARSNIFNEDYGMSACGYYGVAYLR